MSGFNYKTGNIVSKDEAILQIQNRAFEPDPAGTSFDIKIGTYESKPAILVSDIENKSYFLSTFDKRIPLSNAQLTVNEYLVAQSAPGFSPLPAFTSHSAVSA